MKCKISCEKLFCLGNFCLPPFGGGRDVEVFLEGKAYFWVARFCRELI